MAPKSAAEVFRDASGTIVFCCWSQGDELWVEVPRVSRFRLAGDSTHVTSLPYVGASPQIVRDAFHRIALPMMLQARGLEVLHGSAVRTSAGVVVFCADAGTGKSTTAVAMRQRGYEIWADDAVALKVSDQGVRSVRLPFKIRVAAETARLFSQERPPIPSGFARRPIREGESAPLSAIFLLRRASGQGKVVRVRRLDRVAAFPALLEHAFSFELARARRKRRMTRSYLALATRIPVFRVEFQPGLEMIDHVLDAIEAMIPDQSAAD